MPISIVPGSREVPRGCPNPESHPRGKVRGERRPARDPSERVRSEARQSGGRTERGAHGGLLLDTWRHPRVPETNVRRSQIAVKAVAAHAWRVGATGRTPAEIYAPRRRLGFWGAHGSPSNRP